MDIKNCIYLFVLTFTFFAQAFTAGDGTPENPYQISTPQDLEAVNNDLTASYILINDIDLAGKIYADAVIGAVADMADETKMFMGNFNGNGYEILNLTIDAAQKSIVGFFGYVRDADVRNLKLVDVDITGLDFVGAVAGRFRGHIYNSYASGEVAGVNYVGGFSSHVSLADNCQSDVDVTGNDFVGGFVGRNNGTVCRNIYSTGQVSGNDYVGGIAGVYDGYLIDSYSISPVTGVSNVGGLSGESRYLDDIEGCFWDIESSGISVSFGGEGKTTAQMKDIQTYLDAGWPFVGESKIEWADWYMPENGYPKLSWQAFSGGNGTEECPFLIPNKAAFLLATSNLSAHYKMIANVDLAGETFTEALFAPDVYPASGYTGEHFTGVFDGNGYSVKNLRIDASSEVKDDYIGLFGYIAEQGQVQDLILEKLSIKGARNCGGLAGTNDGIIKGCVISGTVNCSGQLTGGLAGVNYGLISDCEFTGEVNAFAVFGGLVGENNQQISGCSASGFVGRRNITSSYSVGGLAGTNEGSISESHFIGNVKGKQDVGGLIGINYSEVQDSYSEGEVEGTQYNTGGLLGSNYLGSVSNCYYNGLVIGNYSDYYNHYYWNTGGLIGENISGEIFNCFSIVDVQSIGENVGGLIGSDDGGNIIECYSEGKVTGTDKPIGGLIGDADKSNLSSCNTISTVNGVRSVGGLIGSSYECIIDSCYSIVAAEGESYVGGLIGLSKYGSLSECYSHGSVTVLSDIGGGLVGDNSASMTKCFSTCDVNGGEVLGGLIGTGGGLILQCYSKGDIVGNSRCGGMVGSGGGTVRDCYSTSSVTVLSSQSTAGGLLGELRNSEVYNSFAAGNITASQDSAVGGLVGYSYYGFMTNCFWDIDTTGLSVSVVGEGKSTAQMQSLATFLDAGWDFVGEETNGVEDIWKMPQSGYPMLAWQEIYEVVFDAGEHGEIIGGEAVQFIEWGYSALSPVVEGNDGFEFLGWDMTFHNVRSDLAITAKYKEVMRGDGTSDYPYQIETVEDLESVNNDLTAHYVLLNSLDLQDKIYAKAVVAPYGWSYQGGKFTGVFDGNGFEISNFNINGGDSGRYLGLFGVSDHAEIKNIHLRDCSVSGLSYVGGLIGQSTYDTVSNCSVSGSVIGSFEYTGGLIGYSYYSDGIFNCRSECSVTGGNYVGGLIGYHYFSRGIFNSYAKSFVTGNNYVGGLVGRNYDGDINSCYSTGEVIGDSNIGGLLGWSYGDVQNSFWDKESSGINLSDGGIGKTISQMHSIYTYMDFGWDFVGEVHNGLMEVWYMLEGDYPRLYWEADKGDVNYDGFVDELDLSVIISQWLSSAAEQQRLVADIDESGEVDNTDFALFAAFCEISASLEIELVAGSNWVSFNVLPEPAALEDVLDGYLPYASDGDKVDSAEGLSVTYYQGSWYGTLETLEPGKMYKIQSQQGGSFIVKGRYADIDTQIELVSGWNWLGFVPSEPMGLEQALSALEFNDNDQIISQNGLNATYWDGSWFGNLEQLEPGAGYLLYVAQPQTFSYGEQQ
ncbi:MAG: GLUG motif-containing protein [Sedimentisphaeraceae bacterium JB056]